MAGVTVTPSMGLYLLLPDHGMAQNNQGQNDQGIKLGVLNGTYSVHITGYVPDSSGNKVPLAVRTGDSLCQRDQRDRERRSDGLSQRSAPDYHVHRHLDGQSRWGQLVGDRHPDQPAISNAALYPVPYAGRQYHQ